MLTLLLFQYFSGQGQSSASPATTSASGEIIFSGRLASGEQTSSGLGVATFGSPQFAIASEPNGGSASVAASGELIFAGAGASTAAAATSSATVELVFSSAAASTAEPGSSASLAELEFSGATESTAAGASSNGSSELGFDGSGDADASAATASSSGELSFDANGAGTADAATGEAAGDTESQEQDFECSGDGEQSPGISEGHGHCSVASIGGASDFFVRLLRPFKPQPKKRKTEPPTITAQGASVAQPAISSGTGTVINPIAAVGASAARSAIAFGNLRVVAPPRIAGHGWSSMRPARGRAQVRTILRPEFRLPAPRSVEPAPMALADDELLAVLSLIE